MTDKVQKLRRIIPYTILVVTIYSVIPYPGSRPNFINYFNNTTFWWLIQFLILLVFWESRKYLIKQSQLQIMILVNWYLLWNIFSIFWGVFISETYWDFKALVGNGMALLIPIIAYAATNVVITKSILIFYLKYTLPLFVVFALLIDSGAYGFYLVPISFISLFLPVLTTRWKWGILMLTIFVIFSDLGARSNVLKFGVPVLFSMIYYVKFLQSVRLLELVRKLLFIAPFFLFVLAISGIFNVFNMQDYVKGDYINEKKDFTGEINDDDLLADTRTFIYIDVLQTAQKYNTWLIGRSPARGNESESFGEDDMNGRGERNGNEVAILNIFTWTGIVGVIFYLLVFYKASYLAINESNNVFSKILGLFIAFRWLYGWVEDINYYTLTTFFLWVMIGLCFSKSFRSMDNNEVKHWVRSIFENLYSTERKFFLKPFHKNNARNIA